jgi:methylmalonyl-CoA/ethylmalonyl-CoA epimerase
MILRLDHIAIAVPDLERAITRFCDDLQIPLSGREDVLSQSTTTAFLPIPGTRLELVHPISHQGPIQGFLEKRGGGLHHLCFETDNILADISRLKARGYRFLSENPTAGAHGSSVIFLHPKDFEGVLIELVQHTSHS